MDAAVNPKFYDKSCKGKVPYDDPAEALTVCVLMRRRRGENVWVCRCWFAGHFHTGHSNPLIRAFIRDLMEPKEVVRLTYTLADTLSGSVLKKMLPKIH